MVAILSFNRVNDGSNGADGVTWYEPSPTNYAIRRTAGAWTHPNYQQLRIDWPTGIILAPGTAYGKSYVDVQGGMSISGLPDASTAPAGANLENVVVDKATGKLYMQ